MDRKKLTEEERSIFRDNIKSIQPIKHDKLLLRKKAVKKRPILSPAKESHKVYLSEYSSEANVLPDEKLFFARSGVSPKQIRMLKQGKILIEATLDLHGFDSQSAKDCLIDFIEHAHEKNKRYVTIIHGKGHSDQPILKNKINNWLRQFNTVLAFCTTTAKHGGAGAVYVLLKARNK